MNRDDSNDDLAATFQASAVGDYGPATSNRNLSRPQADAQAELRSEMSKSWDGTSATYRLGFSGMAIQGLPKRFSCGRVGIHQVAGPIQTQSTYIIQRPGWIPQFDKTMHRGPVLVGDGLILTVCELPVRIPPHKHLATQFEIWHDEVVAAVGVLVAMLDDRVAQQEIFEDLIVVEGPQANATTVIDCSRRVRSFVPTKVITSTQRDGFNKLASWASQDDSAVHVAARWYLRGAQAGPTPDAIVNFWIALEALVPPKSKGRTTDVKGVEGALRNAGWEPGSWDPSIGRCAGLRAKIVHQGEDQSEGLHQVFYALESAVRIVLRYQLNMLGESWPVNVGQTNLPRPLTKLAEQFHSNPRTTIRLIEDERDRTSRRSN